MLSIGCWGNGRACQLVTLVVMKVRIFTKRLELVAVTCESFQAEEQSLEKLAELLGVPIPDDWPPELFDEDARQVYKDQLYIDPDHQDWLGCYILHNHNSSPHLCGMIGYTKYPADPGTVIAGYTICQDFRNQGFATEALEGIVDWAFRQFHIDRIIADTYPRLLASIRVLEKNGFQRCGLGREEGTVRFERLREKPIC